MKIMTFNIRVDVEKDGKNSFKNRIEGIKEFLKKENPDIIGFQEIRPAMLNDLAKVLDNYFFVGEPRKELDEYNPIFFKKSLHLIENKTYWLSNSPEIKGSKHPNAYYPRIFTIVSLEKNNKYIQIINTHLSHISHLARIDGLNQIKKFYLDRKEKHPLILMGDFNAYPKENVDEILSPILTSCWSKFSEDKLTFHDFTLKTKGEPIDYIWIDKVLDFDNVKIHRDGFRGNFLSDHYPISIIIKQ